jgi:hypothetical protein
MGNYICIYPANGCSMYDIYFINPKPVNKAIYEFLYSDRYGFLKDIDNEIVLDVIQKLNIKQIESTKYYEQHSQPPHHQKTSISFSESDLSLTLDDLIIEYLTRILECAKDLTEKK